jgi:hypothetical protein
MFIALPTGVEPDKSSRQDGIRRRRAVHMPNSVGSMCQTARGTKQWDLHTLTGRPAGGGGGLARSLRRHVHGYLP